MITPMNLYKLLIGDFFPNCSKCKNYVPGIVGDGYCKLFANILEARIGKKCGLGAKEFKEKQFKQNNK